MSDETGPFFAALAREPSRAEAFEPTPCSSLEGRRQRRKLWWTAAVMLAACLYMWFWSLRGR